MKDFYEKLKQCLENEIFTEKLLSKGDINSEGRRLFLVKALYFLISTRCFEDFKIFIIMIYFHMNILKKRIIIKMKQLKA